MSQQREQARVHPLLARLAPATATLAAPDGDANEDISATAFPVLLLHIDEFLSPALGAAQLEHMIAAHCTGAVDLAPNAQQTRCA